MARPEKVQAVAEIKERLERAQAVFLAEYAGLSVKEQQRLRRGLRESGAEFKVVKMTLARRAAAELELADLDELFLGPTGIAFADGDPVTAAKALKEFAKENETFNVKGGLLGSEFLSPERISELAEIESREVLLSQLAGAMKAPMAKFAGLLAALPRNFAAAMQQLVDKKQEAGGGEPPAAEAEPIEDAPPESADADAAASVVEEEATGEAVAEEDSASDSTDSAEEATEAAEEPEAVAEPKDVSESADSDESEETEETEETEEAAEASEASDDSVEVAKESDGDDAKSVDEDRAAEAEEA